MSRRVTAGPGDPLYRFGAFIADPVVGRLYCGDNEVPLTPKSFAVLMVLVQSQGRLVDHEELFDRVWPDTFVEPNNLARNVSMIRKALHEHDADREYVVTVTSRGYRFVVPASQLSRVEFAERARHLDSADAAPSSPSAIALEGPVSTRLGTDVASPAEPAHATWQRVPAWIWRAAAICAVSLGVGVAVVPRARTPINDVTTERRLWQLTGGAQMETDPAWSPGGDFVAFSSNRGGSFNIWVQPSSGGSPIQRTFGPGPHWQTSWSPTGHHIAFRSERDGGGIDVVNALGGNEWRISDFGYWPQWSPDGTRVLFNVARDNFTVGLDGKAPVPVPGLGPSAMSRQSGSAWHPDGRRVSVFGNTPAGTRVFWTFAIDGQGPSLRSEIAPAVEQRLRDTGLRLGRFIWNHEGDALYFEGQLGEVRNLWRIRVDPETLAWMAGPDRLTAGTSRDSGLALSPDGTRLAFGTRVERTTAWSFPFNDQVGAITGPGEAITPEGVSADNLDVSPDGTEVVYSVSGRERHELRIWSLDRRTDRLRTVEDAAIVHPRWSPDGRQLSYVRQPAGAGGAPAVVLLSASDDGERRVLPTTSAAELVYDWLGDGRSLLTRCRTNVGTAAICLIDHSTDAGAARVMRVVAEDSGRDLYSARFSPDGRWISFIALSDMTRATVFVTPAGGGAWIRIGDAEGRRFEDKPRWSPDGRTLYFLSNDAGFWNLWGRHFDPVAGEALGGPFQVSHLRSTPQVMPLLAGAISKVQIAVTRDRVILPVAQSSGAIWVLEDVHR